VFGWLTGVYGLVDDSLDLSFITLPLLGIVVLYTAVTFFIFITYLCTIRKVKNHQTELFKGPAKFGSYSPIMVQSRQTDYFGDKLCSIIIPSRNEEGVIRRTVLECLKQTYQFIEILVVCHNCSDRTYEEANIGDSRVRVFDFTTPEEGKGVALNYGVKKSRGKFLLILDGDALLSPDFIEKALPMFSQNYAAVQGKFLPSNRNYNLLTKLLSIEGDLWSMPFMAARSFLGKKCSLGGTGYIIRKEVLENVGLFDNHLVDDFELTFRLLRNNYKIAFAPMCEDYDEKPPSLEIMFRQRSRWARGFLGTLKHPIARSGDLLGHLSWLWPIATIASMIMLIIPAYSAIHYFLFDYYPYTYSYLPLSIWAVLTISIYSLQSAVLISQHGTKALKYIPYLPIYNIFCQYSFVAYPKAIFVKSWANTKTEHGFIKSREEFRINREMLAPKVKV
jgi:cellulose synthase/poly-beta-1,6-N-acetylglucosamine synthase-like glycosyltransferase